MYCRECGEAVSDDARFCPSCGHRVRGNTQGNQAGPLRGSASNQASQSRPGRKRNIIQTVIYYPTLVCLGLGVYAIFAVANDPSLLDKLSNPTGSFGAWFVTFLVLYLISRGRRAGAPSIGAAASGAGNQPNPQTVMTEREKGEQWTEGAISYSIRFVTYAAILTLFLFVVLWFLYIIAMAILFSGV